MPKRKAQEAGLGGEGSAALGDFWHGMEADVRASQAAGYEGFRLLHAPPPEPKGLTAHHDEPGPPSGAH